MSTAKSITCTYLGGPYKGVIPPEGGAWVLEARFDFRHSVECDLRSSSRTEGLVIEPI